MKLNKSLFIAIALIACTQSAFAVNTFTWSLDSGRNSKQYPLFSNLNADSLVGYPSPSTQSLNTNMEESWLVPGKSGDGQSFNAIYRIRPSVKNIPSSELTADKVTFENWAFIRKFIAFGGQVMEGAHVSAPDPAWVTEAHRKGVKIYGTVFIHEGSTVNMMYDLLNDSSIQKLKTLAKNLKLDGWFLNIEEHIYGENTENRFFRQQLKRYIEDVFPDYATDEGVQFITYTGSLNPLSTSGSDSAPIITDQNISDFDRYAFDWHSIDTATGIVAGDASRKYSSGKSYLMFLDGVFNRNIMRGGVWPYRVASAKATQCQFFNGSSDSNGSNWPGFKNYAKARYPAGQISTALCGGNQTSLSVPQRVRLMKISVQPGMVLTQSSTNKTCNGDNQPLCVFEIPYDQSSERIDFNFEANRLISQYTGQWWDSSYDFYYTPSAKWWGKKAEDMPYPDIQKAQWDENYVPIWSRCVTADINDRFCTITFDTREVYEDPWNNFSGYGAYGKFPIQDLVTHFRFYEPAPRPW